LIRLFRHAEQFLDQIGVSDHCAPHAANPPGTPKLNGLHLVQNGETNLLDDG
jgi:hypothetical protein